LVGIGIRLICGEVCLHGLLEVQLDLTALGAKRHESPAQRKDCRYIDVRSGIALRVDEWLVNEGARRRLRHAESLQLRQNRVHTVFDAGSLIVQLFRRHFCDLGES
jgi:hypothetical protein